MDVISKYETLNKVGDKFTFSGRRYYSNLIIGVAFFMSNKPILDGVKGKLSISGRFTKNNKLVPIGTLDFTTDIEKQFDSAYDVVEVTLIELSGANEVEVCFIQNNNAISSSSSSDGAKSIEIASDDGSVTQVGASELVGTKLKVKVKATGPKGEEGKSAYQIWLDNGHTGTEQDFLNSLVGKTGSTGAKGNQGDKGDTGPAGKDGANGKVQNIKITSSKDTIISEVGIDKDGLATIDLNIKEIPSAKDCSSYLSTTSIRGVNVSDYSKRVEVLPGQDTLMSLLLISANANFGISLSTNLIKNKVFNFSLTTDVLNLSAEQLTVTEISYTVYGLNKQNKFIDIKQFTNQQISLKANEYVSNTELLSLKDYKASDDITRLFIEFDGFIGAGPSTAHKLSFVDNLCLQWSEK